ncbi:MAG TPA: YitT family protein [Tissierellaceae bacterium]
MEKLKKSFDLRSFLYMNIGILIISLGFHFFLIPADLAVGGVTGFAIIINNLIPNLSVGLLMLIANAVLIALSFVTLGKQFSGFTVYNSLAISGLVSLFELLMPMDGPIVEDTLLILIYGITIQAVGLAIVFNENSSTGGTDIIAAIINKYFHIDIGKSLFMADFLIALSASYIFGLEKGLYAFLGALLNSILIDKVIAGFNTKIKMVVVSEKHDEILDFITKDVNRGVTVLYGEGGFSKQPRRVINTLLSRREYITTKNRIREIDPKAFIWVSVINEVLGEGFKE